VNQRSEHLSDAQIEQFGKRASGAGPETEAWVETHLDDCPSCRSRVLEFQRTQCALLPDPKVNTVSSPNCPGEEDLRSLAAGLSAEPTANKLKAHAAACGRCGPLLQEYIEDFSDESSPEEQAFLNQLRSASPTWQQQKAREMLKQEMLKKNPVIPEPAPATDWRRFFSWKWVLIPATAVIVLVAITFPVYWAGRDTPEKAEGLLAQAASEKRIMDMRWPGAKWGPIRLTQGSEDSQFNKPKALLKANGIIGEQQPNHPADLEWMRAKAQAEILERKPEAAIADLNQVLDARPESVPAMLDLSIAYAQQGDISLDPAYYTTAMDLLGRVLQKDPGNLTALYNRAVLYEQLHMVDQAIADWTLVLQKETDHDWAEDARKRLMALQELKRSKSSAPSTVDQWTAALASNRVTAAEEAIEAAAAEWLPKAFHGNAPSGQELEYGTLLKKAAQKLQSQHGDEWLDDMLSFSSSPYFAQAISELSRAVSLNLQGQASDAFIPASRAAALFRHAHNQAGVARAELEEVYAYQRSANGPDCLRTARSLRTELADRHYSWISTQLLLDEASCFNIVGRIEEAKLDSDDAMALTEKPAGFKILWLRAWGIIAAAATTRGDRSFAITKDVAGLQEYWAGQYPVIRAYQFYSDLSFNAEAAKLWYMTYAADQEAVWAISQTPNKQVEAAARYRLAKAAVMLGDGETVEHETRAADGILNQLPPGESNLVAQVDGNIGVIRAYLDRGETQVASDHLKQLNLPPEATQSRLIARRLDLLKGDIEFQLKHFQKAQEAYLATVSIAESSLDSLRDDQDRWKWSQENGPSYRALVNTVLKQGNPGVALEIWELYRSASIRQNAMPPLDSEAHLVLSSLDNSGIVRKTQPELRRETVIVYAFLPDGLGIWVVDDSGIDFKFVDMGRKGIRQLARQFIDACSDPQSDLQALRQGGSQLYKALLEPVEQHFKSSGALELETDGELDGLPFSALVDESGKYVIEKYPLLFSPGLAYRHYLRQPEPIRRSDRALIVGDPTISAKWRRILPQLPSAKAAAERVAAKFDNPAVLIGPQASKAELERGLPGARVFQFAGHSIETKSGGVLVLAASAKELEDTGLFTFPRPDSLRQLQLAVLSACSTGRGQVTSPEAIIRPFLMAGVPQVVGSYWKIDSQASAEFIPVMYEQLMLHKTAPEALRTAAIELQQHQAWIHPYYWAPFTLIGRS
jgi:CHAT domain-containing protein